ncbi:MAG: hypothetical protein U0R52_13715 [Solirubrobacterales bacterium]
MRTSTQAESAAGPERARLLKDFALERLPSLQLSDGTFCLEVSAESEGRPQGRSLRETLVVLLGLSRAAEHDVEHPFHLGAIRAHLEAELAAGGIGAGELALALWSDSRAEAAWAADLVPALSESLRPRRLRAAPTMEVGWALVALAEAGLRVELGEGEELLAACRAEILERRPSGHLLTHTGRGARRRLPSFTDQITALVALTGLARVREDGEALDAAVALGRTLVELQMDDGAWPWICDPVRGVVIEPYEIYSTHQDALGMIGLGGLSDATGDDSFRTAALRGLDWSFGANALGARMLDPSAGMIYRSIRRSGRVAGVERARAAAAAYAHREGRAAAPVELEVNRSMRPHQLGWILEAWVGREDLARPAGG